MINSVFFSWAQVIIEVNLSFSPVIHCKLLRTQGATLQVLCFVLPVAFGMMVESNNIVE